MKKILILSAITLFTLFTSVANAGDLDLSNLNLSVGASNSKTAMGDVGNSGLDLGLSYNHDINISNPYSYFRSNINL